MSGRVHWRPFGFCSWKVTLVFIKGCPKGVQAAKIGVGMKSPNRSHLYSPRLVLLLNTWHLSIYLILMRTTQKAEHSHSWTVFPTIQDTTFILMHLCAPGQTDFHFSGGQRWLIAVMAMFSLHHQSSLNTCSWEMQLGRVLVHLNAACRLPMGILLTTLGAIGQTRWIFSLIQVGSHM